MKYLQRNWRSRLLMTLLISSLLSILLVALDQSEWAAQVNAQGMESGNGGEHHKGNKSAVLMMILPILKVMILTGVPMFLTILLMKILITFKRFTYRRTQKIVSD